MLVGLILGALTLKAMRRWAYFHHSGYQGGPHGGCAAGGCGFGPGHGPHGGHRGRRFLYYRWGAPGGFGEGRYGGFGEGRYGGYSDDNPFGVRSRGARPAAKPIPEILRTLELNERQQQEATPVLALAQEWLGPAGPRIEAALLLCAAEHFEPVLAEGLLTDAPEGVQRELAEGLEHLHTILIPEQREQLRTQLSRKKPASTTTADTRGEPTS